MFHMRQRLSGDFILSEDFILCSKIELPLLLYGGKVVGGLLNFVHWIPVLCSVPVPVGRRKGLAPGHHYQTDPTGHSGVYVLPLFGFSLTYSRGNKIRQLVITVNH